MVRAAIVLLMLMVVPSASVAQSEKRIALLIGNEAYTSEIGRLANPHNDVALLEQALKGLGFSATYHGKPWVKPSDCDDLNDLAIAELIHAVLTYTEGVTRSHDP